MALSEIIIGNVVLEQTNATINQGNYHLLRHYLLERKPILTVINTINALLTEHCAFDKKAVLEQLTQVACESQSGSDFQEKKNDDREKNNDHLLRSNYRSELPILENKLIQLETKCLYQQNKHTQIDHQLQQHKTKLSQLNQEIKNCRRELQLVNSSYLYNTQLAPFRTLPPSSYDSHLSFVYSLRDQLAKDRLIQQENRLISEQQRITYLVNTKESESRNEESYLNTLRQEKRTTERRYSEIKSLLDVKLPNKEQQRQLRNQERLTREYARNMDNPHLQQLSYQNLNVLKQTIANQNRELEQKQSQLMDKAIEISYTVYLAQLDDALQKSHTLQLSFNEREALKHNENVLCL
jgi:hypothetical protein